MLEVTALELEVIEAAVTGGTADFSSRTYGQNAHVVIRGDVIRHLLLGLPLSAKVDGKDLSSQFEISSNGVQIRNAYIGGALNLAECSRKNGNPCAPLILENCIVGGTGEPDDPTERPQPSLDARHARIARISLKHCQASFIDLSDALLLGDLDLDGLQPLREGGQCRIAARGLRIKGSLNASGVKLNLRQATVDQPEANRLTAYALTLSGAHIDGDVRLRPDFVADGGIMITGAKIGGDMWIDGGHLIAQGNLALQGQFAQVDGVVGLTCQFSGEDIRRNGEAHDGANTPKRFRAEGGISFLSARIGSLDMRGALLQQKAGEKNFFVCIDCDIQHSTYLHPWTGADSDRTSNISFEADYPVWFDGTTISGDLKADSAKFVTFQGKELEIHRDLYLNSVKATQINLRGATINREVELGNFNLFSLRAEDIHIGGSLRLYGQLSGEANLRGASIDGGLTIGADGEKLQFVEEEGSRPSITLEDAQISRDLQIHGLELLQVTRLNWNQYPRMSIRARKLACYENWQLCEAMFAADDNSQSIVTSFLLREHDESIVVLDEKSSTIFRFNQSEGLHLDEDQKVVDYLKFFSGHTWAEDGPFRIVESSSEIKGLTPGDIPRDINLSKVTLKAAAPDGSREAVAFVVHALRLFETTFKIKSNGEVEMTSDKHLADLARPAIVTYDAPIEFVRSRPLSSPPSVNDSQPASNEWHFPPLIGPADEWHELPEAQAARLSPEIKRPIEFRRESRSKSTINLRALKVGTLDDNHGLRWCPGLKLNLDGFEYDRFDATEASAVKGFDQATMKDWQDSTMILSGRKVSKIIAALVGFAWRRVRNIKEALVPSPSWQLRMEWLGKQYDRTRPTRSEYRPQPYEQVARVYRAQGDYDYATRVLIEKLRIERRLLRRFGPKRIGLWLLDRMFGYGLFWTSALRTFILCWLIGWVGVQLANQGHLNWPPVGSGERTVLSGITVQPVLVVDAAPVSTLAVSDEAAQAEQIPTATEAVTQSTSGRFVKEIRCGDQIEPALYALDTFVPLLDLKQESKCTISSVESAWRWRVAKSAYAILGWIVTSAVILAMSGIVRKHVERD